MEKGEEYRWFSRCFAECEEGPYWLINTCNGRCESTWRKHNTLWARVSRFFRERIFSAGLR